MTATRRTFLAGAAAASSTAAPAEPAIPASFPSHPSTVVREMVTVAHGNAARVKELITGRPALANAAWDWGFGDWETALGAASHMGRRDIAEMLLANGARPTLFSAAMLGQLDVVKATLAARPGVERTLGPHSISLLAHARAGGEQSAEVFRYLQQLEGAAGLSAQDISEAELDKLTGEYTFGSGPDDQVSIARKARQLTLTRNGADARPIHHLGDLAFRPAGAAAVRIQFGQNSTITIHDGDLVLKGSRR